jgi:hypothetical protein
LAFDDKWLMISAAARDSCREKEKPETVSRSRLLTAS